MLPSDRSRSNHTQTDLSAALAGLVPRQVCRLRSRLRLSLAGSPGSHAESSSLVLADTFGTDLPSPAAPHPVSRRRSCLRLHAGSCLRRGYDFHILISWFHGRTRAGPRVRAALLSSRAKHGTDARSGPTDAEWLHFPAPTPPGIGVQPSPEATADRPHRAVPICFRTVVG